MSRKTGRILQDGYSKECPSEQSRSGKDQENLYKANLEGRKMVGIHL